ncbi:hypothetical protein Rwratislav_47130 [Rhodococcus wratislaviensis IFP 2016]|nr:hypothetical protein Rwratislav_47130 [Rhodococcus wratislaviensis IFP 2016]
MQWVEQGVIAHDRAVLLQRCRGPGTLSEGDDRFLVIGEFTFCGEQFGAEVVAVDPNPMLRVLLYPTDARGTTCRSRASLE